MNGEKIDGIARHEGAPAGGLAFNGETAVYGLIGHPVAHSYSPAMHNAALAALGLNGVYVPFGVQPENLVAAMEGLRALGVAGVNVTIPYKEAVMPHLDELAETAILYGAVNTIINRQGRLAGYNTDGPGFIKDLREDHGFEPSQGPALVLGAGGSARAVVMALAQAGCPEVAVVNRNRARAEELAKSVHSKTGLQVLALQWDPGDRLLAGFARRAALVVNCTPLGMSGQVRGDLPLPRGVPGSGQLAYDLVYNPPVTRFLARSAANGAVVANGLGMLLHQGVLSFEAWTGLAAPVAVMRRALYRQAGI
ncbi:shikimate dehydrogenase [Desulfallas thermosapovorans]|uniref:Shikimate dehydrogenase (NADP(+)) n=1 Tax=Desulfallas thermosapovorans DSM 6562 TaxID=1121431 RepID=A0A5S4ZR15_9FIRM|nr:shikimate dehydrogenase [Desulfallas thermosapovorans]TYO95069.1 shikimate dehydrogenase [Desulfallas thermosapovorans DSM 6562]